MKEEKQEAGLDSTVLPQKVEHFALPDSKSVMPARLDGKRKPKAKKTDSLSEDSCFIGQSICGVVDGSFDAGYMLTVRVGDTDTILRGIVFEPGLSVPISEANDIAPNVKQIKRDESIPFPEAPNTSNSMPVRQQSHVPLLPSPVPHAIQTSSFRVQKQIGSGPTDMECCQPHSSPSKSTSISDAVSRLPSPKPTSNAPATSSVDVQNQMEPPERIYFGQKDMVAHQALAVPFTSTFTSQVVASFPYSVPVPDALRMTSLHVQNQVGVPTQTDMMSPQPGAIPSKSSGISQSQSVPVLLFPLPVSNTQGTSSVHVQNQMRYPYTTVGSGKTDTVPSQPDGVPFKSTTISEAVSRFQSPVPLPSTLQTSSVHAQNQMKHPYATMGSVKTETVSPQPDGVPSKSTSISEGVSRLPSPLPLPNDPETSSIHVQDQKRYPYAAVSSGKTDVSPQPDGVPSKSTSISEVVSRLPSPVPLPKALVTLPVNVQMEAGSSLVTGSPQKDMAPPLLDANPSKSTFISQALPLLPSSMPASNNVLATSVVHVHNEMGSPATGCSGQKDTVHVPNAPGVSSVHLQNQTGLLMMGSSQIDMVAPMSDENKLKSAFISRTSPMLPSSMLPSNNARATSTVHVQNEVEHPAASCSAQNDILSVPDARGTSSLHLETQTELPLTLGPGQINMVLPQPDPIPSKSTSIFQAATTSLSSMDASNTLGISSTHVQNQMGSPAAIGSGQTDTVPQQDTVLCRSTSVVQTVPILPPALPDQNASASKSFFVQKIEPPVSVVSGQTDLVPSQPDVILPKSISISQTLPMLSVPVPVSNAPSSSSVFIQNQMEPPVKIESGDKDLVPFQLSAFSPKISSILQSPATFPVPNARSSLSSSSSSIILQKQMRPPVTIEPGQTDTVATKPEQIPCIFPCISQSLPMLQASIPITFTGVASSKPSTNSGQDPDSRPSEHDFHSTEATETRMDVDGAA